MLLNRIDSIPASEKAGTLYLRIYPYVDPDKITTMFLFATSPLLSQSGNAKSSIKGNTLNSDSLNRKSPCSSSLYKRRHCLPSVLPRGHSCGSTTSYDTLQQKGAFIMSSYFPALSSALRYTFLPNPDHNRCHIRSCGSRGRDHPTFQEEHPSIRDDSSTSPR